MGEHFPDMHEHKLVSDFIIPKPRLEVFAFFSDAANLERITPPWLNFKVLTPLPIQMKQGALIEYRIKLKGVPMGWRTLISAWDAPHSFVDEQLKGPYALWHHTHEFFDAPASTPGSPSAGTRMVDTVRYALPLGPLGWVAHGLFVRRDLERIFAYRREHIEKIMGKH